LVLSCRNYSNGRTSATGRSNDPLCQRVLGYDKDSEAALTGQSRAYFEGYPWTPQSITRPLQGATPATGWPLGGVATHRAGGLRSSYYPLGHPMSYVPEDCRFQSFNPLAQLSILEKGFLVSQRWSIDDKKGKECGHMNTELFIKKEIGKACCRKSL
jgi:hypothetical protein